MSLSDHDFFRLDRNYLTHQGICTQETIEDKRLVEELFLKPTSSYETNGYGSGSLDMKETEKKTFVNPIICPGLPRQVEEQPKLPFPRLILRIPLGSPFVYLLDCCIQPSTVPWMPSIVKKSKTTTLDSSSAKTTATIPASPSYKKTVGQDTDVLPPSNTTGGEKHRLSDKYIIRQIIFSDSTSSINLSTLRLLHNSDWTSNGKFIVVCAKQGLLLGDVATGSFVASATGEYSRVSCHPTLPTVFASLLASSSLIIYEITGRANGKPGHLTYSMKIIAEMKFTSVKLSGVVLSWSPLGNMLVISSHERGLYLLAFEEITQDNGHHSPLDASLAATLPSISSRAQRPRRVLRIIGQGKFENRITGAMFRCVYKNAHYNAVEASLNPAVEKALAQHIELSKLFLYVSLENGQLWSFPVDTTAKFLNSPSFSHQNVSQHSLRVNSGVDITCFDVDPFNGRFIVLGGADNSLYVMDSLSEVITGAHYRIGAPMDHVAVSPGGLLIAWAPQFLMSLTTRTSDWSDVPRTPQTRPCVCISRVGPPLEFLWKVDVPAAVSCLRWHPWLPALVVVCDSSTRLSSSYYNPSTSTRESYTSGSSQQTSNTEKKPEIRNENRWHWMIRITTMLEGELYEKLKNLDEERQKMEKEIDGLVSILTSEGMPGISGPLVDSEGFPRQDIDLYLVRNTRHRLACLKTDYKEISQRIEQYLHELHKQSRVSVSSSSKAQLLESPNHGKKIYDTSSLKAFSYIDQLEEGSVAQLAGLCVNDQVLQLGFVCLAANEGYSSFLSSKTPAELCDTIADCFRILSEHKYFIPDKPFDIIVLRANKLHSFTLTLKEQQKLGCHLTPLHTKSL